VIPEAVDYRRPASAAEAAALLEEDARVVGGGTWVVPELQRGVARAHRLVDLRDAGLRAIEPAADGGLRIGATATYADLLASAAVAERAPLLRLVAGGITGGWAIRNQGTVGGSVAAARPSSDLPAALVALGAQALVVGRDGSRHTAVADLLAGAMRTTLAPGELIVGFALPAADGAPGYVKLKRGAGSWPIATAAAGLALDHAGRCAAVTLVLGAVAATPVRVDLSAGLIGQAPDGPALADAAVHAAAAVAEPWSDALAPAEYRAAVAAPVARRALEMALQNARDGR
jgi:CO/xanthine dehydrogenase FAD-binding subunit